VTYDSNGNTLTKTVGSDTTSYTWDFENRMSSVTLPGGGGAVSFKYDPLGRRIYKSLSTGGTSVFEYDGDNLIEETNSSGTVIARYEQTQNIDEPLAMLRSSATSYYQADGLGSVTSLSNGAGALAQTYTFDSFGKQTASSGSLVNPFQYSGRESDAETGLYFYRARSYDQSTGRFIGEDPVRFAAGQNFYSYVLNSPTNRTDPFGLWTFSIGLSINIQAGPINVQGSVGVAVDSSGHVGTIVTGGGGLGVGAAVSGGLSIQGSNAKTISDLGCPFANGSVGGSLGIGGSIDQFHGQSPNGPVTGGGFTIGPGVGGGASGAITETLVIPWTSAPDTGSNPKPPSPVCVP
jgi:RHS repeat-associated protein